MVVPERLSVRPTRARRVPDAETSFALEWTEIDADADAKIDEPDCARVSNDG
jgi:hypothetical protein